MGTPCYRILADAFVKEGVTDVFALTGDGNMYWEAAYTEAPGTRTINVRHEHAAVAMASAYARVADTVGVASVTCGPGVTQISTALATAVQARIPLVIFAGESPLHGGWYNQSIDLGPIVTATGARYIPVHSTARLHACVLEAFHHARSRNEPVVLGVPFDLQKEKVETPGEYTPSTAFLPDAGPRWPHPDYLARAVDRLRAARRVVVIAGRGARGPDARDACIRLAERVNGALATTLPMRGLFAGHKRDIGSAGSFGHPATGDALKNADLIIAVGASLRGYTSDHGRVFPPEKVLQIDEHPTGLARGRATAALFLAADAALGVSALADAIEAESPAPDWPDWGAEDYARRLRSEPIDSFEYPVEQGTLDPRAVIGALDAALPKDWGCVNSSGHSSFFSAHMLDRPAGTFLTIREFGAIGNGLGYAAGMAAARPNRPTVLLEGDGGLMVHIQELETIRLQGWKILICVLNDGAYGAEIHKLRADGLSDKGGVYGRNDLARMAEGFGIRGAVVDRLEALPGLIEEFRRGEGSMLLDIQVSDQVISPRMAMNIGLRK
ncbi:thiamine pyrophosphate-binding protein [Maritimibacter sp. HL-12]|uniref:thiamine pyrophosphate-binding protein n=1 Tax=Maritimibacter sp. HL-12 TaxID=1162418 RepID=UPI000A0F1CA2|nr:thiamine pyrophosphate-binding protein [Maritimibacter sp. HL-12]SMH28762.1 Acetolactate synthase large subunit [Maritimibacter sp. HL-12]